MQAIGVPEGFSTLASVANEMIKQTGCNTVGKLLMQIYPKIYSSPEQLQLTTTQLQNISATNPELTACIMSVVAAAG